MTICTSGFVVSGYIHLTVPSALSLLLALRGKGREQFGFAITLYIKRFSRLFVTSSSVNSCLNHSLPILYHTPFRLARPTKSYAFIWNSRFPALSPAPEHLCPIHVTFFSIPSSPDGLSGSRHAVLLSGRSRARMERVI